MVVKVKVCFEKKQMLKITTNLKSTFYEDKERQDIMIVFYLIREIIHL